MSGITQPKGAKGPYESQNIVEITGQRLKKLTTELNILKGDIIPENLTSESFKQFVKDLHDQRDTLKEKLKTEQSEILNTAHLTRILRALQGYLVDPAKKRILVEAQAASIYNQALGELVKELDDLHRILKQLDEERGGKVAKTRNDPR